MARGKRRVYYVDQHTLLADGWKPKIVWLVVLKSELRTAVRTYKKHPKSYMNYKEAVKDATEAIASGIWDIVIVTERMYEA